MEWKKGASYEGFCLLEETFIEEVQGVGRLFCHEKSGVTLISLSNDDPHKVFSIGFQTLPDNNKGAAHIVEHSVCCASVNYPLKETFMALQQGSMSTVLNACTYPDMTMYYAASPHEKDLMGIAKVYIDLVFHPLIYKNDVYFKQEGWHYTLEHMNAYLDYSGVVYHEMEGEYASAATWLEYYKMKALFPDNIYQYDAGGMPEEIVQLSEEEFLDFHRKYYEGDNAYICLYGNGDLREQLKALNKHSLNQISKGHYKEKVRRQAAFTTPKEQVRYYPADEKTAQSIFNLSFVVGACTDTKLRLSFEILEHMLLRSAASPLLKALVLEEELGISLSDGGYDACRKQPVFSITLKGCDPKEIKRFETVIMTELERLATEGIPQALIEASMHTLAIELREVDAGYEPIGVQYSEMLLNNYLHGGKAFAPITYKEAFMQIKEVSCEGYFENLIKKYLLQNTHRLLLTLVPKKSLLVDKIEEKRKKLLKVKMQMSKKECRSLMKENIKLEQEQLVENDKELLKRLPHLTKGDMPNKLDSADLEAFDIEDCKGLYLSQQTSGIGYFHFLFDVGHIKPEDLSYLGLLAHLFSYMGTKKKSYQEIENAINTYTGGIHSALHAYTLFGTKNFTPIFKISGKVLIEELLPCMNLMIELFTESRFVEAAKLKEAIGNIVYEMERSFVEAPQYRSVQRFYTYFSPAGAYEEKTSGIDFYHFIKQIYEDFDTIFDTLSEKLQTIFNQVMRRDGLRICLSAEKKDRQVFIEKITPLIKVLSEQQSEIQRYDFLAGAKREGFCISQDVQAIVQGFDYKKAGFSYHGSYEVVCNILENTYLWDRLRLQKGAYGCEIMMDRDGDLAVCSYCDPHLESTLQVFKEISAYLNELEMDEEILERYIISTLSGMLTPLSNEQKSERACSDFITGMPPTYREQIYQEMLNTTTLDFKKCSALFEAMNKENAFCVMGSKKQLIRHKELFDVIHFSI